MTEELKQRGEGQVLGLAVGDTAYGLLGVIGPVSKSGAGHTILPIGHKLPPHEGPGWEKTEHVALTADEREQLIAELIAQR